jgi:hypothetical protein
MKYKQFIKNLDELKKHLIIIKQHINFFSKVYEYPLNSENISDIVNNQVEKLDSLAYRFLKLQDTLGKTLKLYFSLKEENTDNLTMLDILNLAEKVGFSISVTKWRELRELRNILSYEYEDNYDKIANSINYIADNINFLETIVKEIEEKF